MRAERTRVERGVIRGLFLICTAAALFLSSGCARQTPVEFEEEYDVDLGVQSVELFFESNPAEQVRVSRIVFLAAGEVHECCIGSRTTEREIVRSVRDDSHPAPMVSQEGIPLDGMDYGGADCSLTLEGPNSKLTIDLHSVGFLLHPGRIENPSLARILRAFFEDEGLMHGLPGRFVNLYLKLGAGEITGEEFVNAEGDLYAALEAADDQPTDPKMEEARRRERFRRIEMEMKLFERDLRRMRENERIAEEGREPSKE